MILYHYCSTEAFLSIISSRTIRLSSLTQSNDSQEGAVILELLLKHTADLGLGDQRQAALQHALHQAYDVFDGAGFCLSGAGDLLSQWRGYADDGRGLSIGFHDAYLEKLRELRMANQEWSFALRRVIYDSNQQEILARQHLENLKEKLATGAFSPPQGTVLAPNSPEQQQIITDSTLAASLMLLTAMLKMFDVKNPAFIEEQEWRLLRLSIRELESDTAKFRACGDKIIPYYEVELPAMDINPIGEVILGPRHQSPPQVIEQLLSKHGFKGVSVRKSSASYR